MAGTGSAGSLVVSLGLNAAEYFQGLTKAEYEARKFASTLTSTFVKIGGALGIALSANAFKDMIQGSIEATARLGELGARAGLTGAQVSSLTTAAKLAHTDIESLVTMSGRLSKAFLDFGNDGAKSTQVLKAIGFTAKDVADALADPAQGLKRYADLINSLPEGGTKAAANLLVLGRNGGQVSAALRELASQTQLVQKRTNEEIAAAKEFDDTLIKLGISTDGLKTRLALALLPTLQDVLDLFVKTTQGSGGLRAELDKLIADGSIQEWARTGAIAVGTLAESLILIGRLAVSVGGSFKVVAADVAVLTAKANAPSQKLTGAYGFTPEEAKQGEAEYQAAVAYRNKVVQQADKGYENLINADGAFITKALQKSFDEQDRATKAAADLPQNSDRLDRLKASTDEKLAVAAKAAAAAKAKAVQDALNRGNAVAAGGDDPTKKILDGQIKALEDNIAREKELLATREEFIALSFQQGYLSIKDSYDRTQEARDEELRKVLGFYDQEIALQRAFIAKGAKNDVERADAANKIAGYQDKQTQAVNASTVAAQRQAIARTIADDQYAAQLDELNAKIQELAGNTEKAAAIRFGTSQNTPFFRSLTPEARDQFNAIGQQEIAQKALNDKNTEFRLILDAVGTAQEKINLLQQTGAISEIDALVKTSAAARQQIEVLTDLADKAEIAAQALTGIAKLEAIANVERLRLEIAKLGSQTDLLGDKFQNIFKTSFVDNLTAAIAGTKSWADAFKDAEKQIVESISRIAAQNIGDALFGKEGPLGGLGSIFGQIFGSTASGGDKGAGAAAANAALGTLSLTSATVTTSFATVATSAAAAAAALSTVAATSGSSSAGGLAGLFSGIFGGGGGGYGQFDAVSGYAKGTDFHPGGLAWVGEGGKELLNLPRGTQVIPQDKLRGMGRPNLSIVVNVPQGTSGPSADQIGVRVGAHVQRALNRNS